MIPSSSPKSSPDYVCLGKRTLQDNGSWLAALKRDDVELVTDPIARIEPDGVVCESGVRHPVGDKTRLRVEAKFDWEDFKRARRGDGPTLLEFKPFRMRGHEEASGTAYVPKALTDEWASRDPIARFETFLDEAGTLPGVEREAIRAALKRRIDDLVDEALQAPDPDSTPEREIADVFAPSGARPDEPPPAAVAHAPERRYVDAISDGLRAVMRRSPNVVLLGQDIAEYGGVFKITEGFVEEFGKARVRNTPIIESGAIGAALGLALDGFVPMIEMQFGDFVT